MSVASIRDRSRSTVMPLVARIRVASPLAAFLVATAGLLATVPGGSVRGVELTTDATALEVAGRSTLAVVGYINLGQQHLYVTGDALLLIAIASVLATRGGLVRLAGIVLGAGAAGGLIVVTGCPCGTGSATPLWRLAVWRV